jgi:hypothetical protein
MQQEISAYNQDEMRLEQIRRRKAEILARAGAQNQIDRANESPIGQLYRVFAGVAGAPVDIGTAIWGAMGVDYPEGSPGSSKGIREGMRQQLGLRVAEDEPSTFGGRLGQVGGEAAAAFLPMGGAAKLMSGPARTALNAPKSTIQRIAREGINSFRQNPIATMAIEGAGVAGAAGARHQLNDVMEDVPTGWKVVGEVAGGLAGATAATVGPAVSIAGQAVKRTGRFISKYGGRAANYGGEKLTGVDGFFKRIGKKLNAMYDEFSIDEASKYLQSEVEDPSALAAQIREGMDTGLTGATYSNNPHLLEIENNILANIDTTRAVNHGKRTRQVVQRYAETLEKSGDAADVAKFAAKRMESARAALDANVELHAEKAVKAATQLDPGAPPEQIAAAWRTQLEASERIASNTEAELFSAIPFNIKQPTSRSRDALKSLVENTPVAQRGNIPSLAGQVLDVLPEQATVHEMYGVYKQLGVIGRQAMAKGPGYNPDTYRMTNILRDAVLEDMKYAQGGTEVIDKLRAALDFSAAKNQTYTTGPVAQILGRTERGALLTDEILSLESLGVGGRQGRVNADALAKATDYDVRSLGAMQDYMKASFVNSALDKKAGMIDPAKAQAFLDKHEVTMGAFPALREQLEAAKTPADVARRVTKRNDFYRRQFQRPEVSHAAKLLKGPAVNKVRAMFDSDDPAAVAKSYAATLRKDPSGKAIKGMKAAIGEWMTDILVPGGVLDADARHIPNATALRWAIRGEKSRDALGKFFSKKEIEDIDNTIDILVRYQNAERIKSEGRNAAAQGGERTSKIVEAIGRFMGAKAATALTTTVAGPGSAGTQLQAAQIGAGFGKRGIAKFGLARSKEIYQDAILNNPALLSMLLDVPHETVGSATKQAAQAKWKAWLAGPGSRLFEDEEQPE